jgi:hypothetical protein
MLVAVFLPWIDPRYNFKITAKAPSQGRITRRPLFYDLRTLLYVELFVGEEEEGVSTSRREAEGAGSAIVKAGNTQQNGVRARK